MRLTGVVMAVVAAVGLAGCAIDRQAVGATLGAPAVSLGSVDAAAAARMISDYRASRGLSPVAVDNRLIRIAADQVLKMGAAGQLAHVLPGQGSFQRRIEAGGYNAAIAAENIGAGYDSLAEAIAGWKASPDHNINLLRPGLTQIGIAVANAPGTRYGTWWSLVLASPYEGPSAASAGGGFSLGPFRLFGR
jgi:uncharacterized protein YkwD